MTDDGTVDLPFRADYAKSGRAGCKGCKDKIEKGHLRLAAMVQSPFFDGKAPHWYHSSCFFMKQRPKSTDEISHFESLRWEDQEKISKHIGNTGTSTSNSSSYSKITAKRKSNKSNSVGEFRVENSKSSRATCRGCEEKIIKGEIRISKKDYESEEARQYGGIDRWHHLECFARMRYELEYFDSGSKLPGIKAMNQENQVKIKDALPEVKPVKKKQLGEKPEKIPKLDDDLLKKQNKLMYYYRDGIKNIPKKSLITLLQYNGQQIPEGTERILDRLCDAMAFGALQRCTVCHKGQLVFRSGVGYFCLGNRDEWTKCESVFDDPPKKSFQIPEHLKEEFEFLNTYKFEPQKRIFVKVAPSQAAVSEKAIMKNFSTKNEPGKSESKVERHLPLRGMEFVVVGKPTKSKTDLKLEIMKLGGVLGSKIHDMTTAIISTKETVKKKDSNIKIAEKLNIQVVPECFLDECKSGSDAIPIINRLNLATWGSDPSTRIVVQTTSHNKSNVNRSLSSRYKSNASKVTLKVKEGTAVDPDSNLEDVAHVYRDPKGNIYNAAMSLSDVQTGKNSYYKLQVLESENKNYWLFRSWGRIGTTIGGNKLETLSRETAIDQFKVLFMERTGNAWDNRKLFVKVPGKMAMLDICYEDDDQVDTIASEYPSNLAIPVQDLIQLIFNVAAMKNVMKEMELDLEKMPLGKLSKKQIQDAFKVLTKLQDCIRNSAENGIDTSMIISYTNQFFTLIPHDFGILSPPLLNDLEVLKQKTDMLDSLMEIEIAYSLLRETEEDSTKMNPIDAHYMKLNAEVAVLDKISDEFEFIKQYIENTHAETHKNYVLDIIEVFKVKRYEEEKRFDHFKHLHNRKLLWHGSRLTNFAGILFQGLRIAPPEAPVTGYMFGKGIYFADMVSKSANYCMTNPANNVGLLLLCEVALGDMHELYNAECIVKPPKGKHSVKGVGKTQPDPKMSKITRDGIEIPLGTGIPSGHKKTSLLYNEYIVYDVAQVKVQYLVQTKFNFTY